MRKAILFLAALATTAFAYGQVGAEWREPGVPAVGREYPATDFMSYTAREAAVKNDHSASPYYHSLNGVWKHKHVASGYFDLNEDVFSPGYDVSAWENVDVPQKSIPEQLLETVAGLPHDVSVDVFRTEFYMPFAWADKQVFLEIGSAHSGVLVFVNGLSAGYAEDAKAPAVYDVTALVKEGNNTLAVAATGWSTGSQLERGNRTSGTITGNVCIKALPKIRVRDFEIRTDLTENNRNGVLDFGVVVKSHLLNQKEATVYFELFSPEGQLLKSESKAVSLRMRQEQTVHFDALVSGVQAWSAEHPALYTVMTRIQHEGRYTEYIERKVGFRSIGIAGGQLQVNGKPIVFRGISVTDFPADPDGMTETFRWMKLHQINAIRPVHGPLPGLFYELCDAYGFYVLSEAHIDSRASGFAPETTLGNRPDYLDAHLDRVKSVYERTKNHASVVLFSLGDQGGNGYNFYEAYLWMKSREKTRPVLYAGAGREWNTDVVIDGNDPLRPVLAFENPRQYPQGGFSDDREVYASFVPIELRRLGGNEVEVINRTDFLSLDRFDLTCEIVSGNRSVSKGVIPCTLAPGESGVFRFPPPRRQGEYQYRFELVVREPFGIYRQGDVIGKAHD